MYVSTNTLMHLVSNPPTFCVKCLLVPYAAQDLTLLVFLYGTQKTMVVKANSTEKTWCLVIWRDITSHQRFSYKYGGGNRQQTLYLALKVLKYLIWAISLCGSPSY